MTGIARSIASLLVAIFMIMAGSGFLATLVSLRLEVAGAPALVIGLVLVYSVGASAGPLPASVLMDAAGPRGLFLFIAICAALLIGFAIFRLFAAPPVPDARQRRFLILPRTTPLAARLDPLAPDN